MSILFTSFNAVLPYLLYLCLGHFAHRFHLMDDQFSKKLNSLIFRLFYPVTMFVNTYTISFDSTVHPSFLLFVTFLLVGVIALSMFMVPHFITDNRRKGAVVHCLYRSNIVLFAMGLTEALYGKEALAAASLIVAVFVPLYNVAAVMILEYYRGGKADLSILLSILKNPMLIGAVSGILFSLLSVEMPASIADILSDLSGVTIPLAMMVLGATLSFSALNDDRKCIVCTIVVKMILIPLCALLVSVALSFSSLEVFLSFIVFATPVAANAYTMSENMEADGALAGEIVATSMVVSLVTLFAWIVILQNIGII